MISDRMKRLMQVHFGLDKEKIYGQHHSAANNCYFICFQLIDVVDNIQSPSISSNLAINFQNDA